MAIALMVIQTVIVVTAVLLWRFRRDLPLEELFKPQNLVPSVVRAGSTSVRKEVFTRSMRPPTCKAVPQWKRFACFISHAKVMYTPHARFSVSYCFIRTKLQTPPSNAAVAKRRLICMQAEAGSDARYLSELLSRMLKHRVFLDATDLLDIRNIAVCFLPCEARRLALTQRVHRPGIRRPVG